MTFLMTPALWVYLAVWSLFSAVALSGLLRSPKSYSIASAAYWRFLCAPWKLATFAMAAVGLVFIAPYTGDPTWDYADASFMAVLTFMTAPWSVGTLYLSIRRRQFDRRTMLAICLWMFSASWSYDLYLLLRDGRYPVTWLPNIFASSVLYCSAGLLWNLDWRAQRGVTFSFMEEDWFAANTGGTFRKIVWFALPFMLLAAVAILSFVV
ncbi:MAG: hypothetical protein LBI48_12270 [Burkholderiaceae bacterium]|jgi:hypothetical protein|nr:hypothetical protein [Burkholderiaceae bacterium]